MKLNKFLAFIMVLTTMLGCEKYEIQHFGGEDELGQINEEDYEVLITINGKLIQMDEELNLFRILDTPFPSIDEAYYNVTGDKIVCKPTGRNLHILDAKTGLVIEEILNTTNVSCFNFHLNGETVYYLTANNTIGIHGTTITHTAGTGNLNTLLTAGLIALEIAINNNGEVYILFRNNSYQYGIKKIGLSAATSFQTSLISTRILTDLHLGNDDKSLSFKVKQLSGGQSIGSGYIYDSTVFVFKNDDSKFHVMTRGANNWAYKGFGTAVFVSFDFFSETWGALPSTLYDQPSSIDIL